MLESMIRTAVYRRFAAVVITLLVAIYGYWAYSNTPIEAYPDVTNLQVGIIAVAPGLAPEEIERQITYPLERALNGTPGMIAMRSESHFGLSLVWLIFEDNADSFRSRALVAERLTSVDLPPGVTAEMAPNYTPLGKVFYYQLTSDRHALPDVRAEQEWNVTRVMRQVSGVADVVSIGGFLKEIHVEVDPARLVALDIDLDEVATALQNANLNVGGGILRRNEQALIVRGIGLMRSPRDIEDVVLRNVNGVPIRVGQVARVVQSHAPRQGAVGVDEVDDVVVGVVLLRRGANPSQVLDAIHSKVDELNTRILPAGMKIEPIYDRSELIGKTLKTVHSNLMFGAALIVGVVWLFLRSLRGSLVVAAVIPLSLLVAFIGLSLLGMPANLISMGAIDFGIIVDGAIVLSETVIHHIRMQRPQTRREVFEIIVHSAQSVARPIVYAMAIVIAALIPVFTLESVEGRIFRPLALTYSFALIGALVFSLTIVPALCAFAFRPNSRIGAEPALFERMRARYQRGVERLITLRSARMVPMVVGAVMLVIGGVAASRLGTEFLPELDEGDIYVLVQMPSSISLETGQQVLAQVRQRLGAFPEVIRVVSEQGRPEQGTDNETINIAKVLVRMKSRDQWRPGFDRKQMVGAMRVAMSDIPGVLFNFAQPIRDSVEEASSGARGHVVVKVFGSDLEKMRATLREVIEQVRPIAGVVDLDLYRDAVAPQLHVNFDRDKLARHGLSIKDAATALETSLAGQVVTTYWEGERMVPVRVSFPYVDRMDERRVREIPLATKVAGHVPVGAVAEVSIRNGNASIFRESNTRFMALKFNIEGRDMGSVINEAMQRVNGAVKVPDGYFLEWGGAFENQQRAVARLRVVIPLSLLVVFGLLYGALDSARSALSILLVAPFAMTGGIVALYLTGIALSVSAAIGFIALLGQVALAGLLILSAIEERRKAGIALDRAITEGSVDRLRSVLLVSLLAMLGLLPMAFSTGVGSETQRPFATVIVGGMAVMPFVILFLLPLVHRWVGSRRKILDNDAPDASETVEAEAPRHG
ncbi:MAG: efflux RND transporter permease subunit [Burkholderiales bacterium]|nr:efflux RND transporter permease subunit [Burkholderiales bacterium]